MIFDVSAVYNMHLVKVVNLKLQTDNLILYIISFKISLYH